MFCLFLFRCQEFPECRCKIKRRRPSRKLVSPFRLRKKKEQTKVNHSEVVNSTPCRLPTYDQSEGACDSDYSSQRPSCVEFGGRYHSLPESGYQTPLVGSSISSSGLQSPFRAMNGLTTGHNMEASTPEPGALKKISDLEEELQR